MQCKCLCMSVRHVYHCVCTYRCIHLKELKVCSCSNITDAGISMVVRQCSQLRVLNLYDEKNITGMCALCEDPEPTLCAITGIWYSYSRFITDHKGSPLDHIVSQYNSAYNFTTFSLILRCIACCSLIHPIIVHIFEYLGSDLLCFPQSVQYIFIGLPALIFPCRIKFKILLLLFSFIIFSWNCFSKFLSSSSVIASFLFWSQYFNFYSCHGKCFPFLSVIFC